MPRKPWTQEEEQILRQMFEKGSSIAEIAEKLNRPMEGVCIKIWRLNLKPPLPSNAVISIPVGEGGEGGGQKIILNPTSTAIEPKELLTHEAVLKILSGALQRLQEGNLDSEESKRLKILGLLASRYDTLLERFERWDEIEKRILAVEARLEEVASKKQA